jgi:hypothetical protein
MKEPMKSASIGAMKEKDKKGKPAKLQGARIEVAANGYKLNLHHASETGFPSYPDQPGTVHSGKNARKDLMQHIDSALAKHEGAPSAKGPRPAPGTNLIKPPVMQGSY